MIREVEAICLVCKYTCTFIAREQGESGHISEINILPSLISLVDIPTLRCMSKSVTVLQTV